MMQRRNSVGAIAIVLALAVQICGCGLLSTALPATAPPPTRMPAPTRTATPTSTPTQTPTLLPTLAPTPRSLLDTEEPFLISGEILHTSPFFNWGLSDAFVLLEDEAGFVKRDTEFEFPLASQVLGPIEVGPGDNLSYSLLLPAVPQGTYVDVDHDGEDETGVQVFAVAYWPNVWGDTFLEERDGTGWSSAEASTVTDPDRDYEITGGILVVWAPDDRQDFPIGFGDDGLLFTGDDPTAPIPAGYNIVDLDEQPFRIYKEAQPRIDLLEGDLAVSDYSDMSYEEAFDALFTQISREYAFTEQKGIDWDTLYDEFSPRVARARNAEEFYVALRDFTWSIPDGHIGVGGDPATGNFFEEHGGGFGLVVKELSDGRVIASQVLPDLPADAAGIAPGAEIVTWGGKTVGAVIDETPAYFGPYSTEQDRRLGQIMFLTRVPVGTEVAVTYRNPGAGTRTATMTAESEVDSLLAALPSYDELTLPIEGEILDESGLGYIRITTFAGNYKQMADLWTHYIQGMIDNAVPGLVIDLRINGGGSGDLANDFAGYFFRRTLTLAYWWSYNSLTEEFERDEIPQHIEPAPLYYRGPVVLLVGPDCISACEGFAYAMTREGRALVVGHYPTAGAYGGVGDGQVTLPDGLELQFPTTRSTTPGGEIIIEGVGIAPDIVVPVTEESALGLRDTVLDKAIETLLEEIGQ